jgi:hypothetical protein
MESKLSISANKGGSLIKPKWILVSRIAAVMLGAACRGNPVSPGQKVDELQEQLRLARAEGIPTTAAEFAKLIKPCLPEENAAPYYRKIEYLSGQIDRQLKTLGWKYYFGDLADNVLFDSSGTNLALAHKLLDANKSTLAIIDEAVAKPHCWFNRDWSQGMAMITPEIWGMKDEARLLLTRAEVEAADGKHDLALDDIGHIQLIAKHLEEEQGLFPQLVGTSVNRIAMGGLINLSYRFRENPEYWKALKAAIDHWSPPNDKAENSRVLFNLLWLMDAVKTKKGLDELGITPDVAEIPEIGKMVAKEISRGKGKADVVKACRQMWRAYSLPSGENRRALLRQASSLVMAGLMSEPLAWKIAAPADDHQAFWDDGRDQYFQAFREMYVAAYRALSANPIPAQIKTDDLLSPFDGKPLRYHHDGKQVTIEVDSKDPDKPSSLKIPPDPPKP